MGVEKSKRIEIAIEGDDHRGCRHHQACEKQAEDQFLVTEIQFGEGKAGERRRQHHQKRGAAADDQAIDEVAIEAGVEPDALVGCKIDGPGQRQGAGKQIRFAPHRGKQHKIDRNQRVERKERQYRVLDQARGFCHGLLNRR